jgi:predicted Co/Zn/Cd cation transporter (cation efflux family)
MTSVSVADGNPFQCQTALEAISIYLLGVKPIDPVTFAVVSLVFVAVALGAVYRPGRRVTEVDPMTVLRCAARLSRIESRSR